MARYTVRWPVLILMHATGSAYDARNMFKVMDQDKNGYMEFAEFVLLLIRPTTAEEMSPDQFASRTHCLFCTSWALVTSCVQYVYKSMTKMGTELSIRTSYYGLLLRKRKVCIIAHFLVSCSDAVDAAEGRTTRAHRDQIEEVVNKIITYIDSNSDGKITKEELVTAIQKDPYLKKIL